MLVLESLMESLFTRSSKLCEGDFFTIPMLQTMALGIQGSFSFSGGSVPQKEGLRSNDKSRSIPLSDCNVFLEGDCLDDAERRDLDDELRCLDALARFTRRGSAATGESQVAFAMLLVGLFFDRIMLADLKSLSIRY